MLSLLLSLLVFIKNQSIIARYTYSWWAFLFLFEISNHNTEAMHTEIDNDNVRQQFTRQTQLGKTTIVEKPAWNGDVQSIIITINVYKESQSIILSLLLTVSCYKKYHCKFLPKNPY